MCQQLKQSLSLGCLGLLLANLFSTGFLHAANGPMQIYVGTYTGDGSEDSQGIYVVDFDDESGALGTPRLAAKTTNPSYLTIDSDNHRVLSVSEVRSGDARNGAALVSWQIEANGLLRELGRAATGGDGPCYVDLEPQSQLAGVANYGGGSVAVFQLDSMGVPTRIGFVQHTGHSVNPARQGEPHAHSFQFVDGRELALAADLGTDELIVYDLAASGQPIRNNLLTTKMTPGHGPRHFAFSPDRRAVAVIQEMSSTMTLLSYDDGSMKVVAEASTFPADFTAGNSTAEVLFHPNGRWLYGSNRGHDSIAVFSVDLDNKKLAMLGTYGSGGKTPRNFRISPDGRWLITANQSSNNLVVFQIAEDGTLVPTDHTATISMPVCIKFVP